jgi:hypothetical protein
MLLHGRLNGFSEFFDELIFVTDELKAGDIRADLIALGGKAGEYFPVFIELKGIRLRRVIEQLILAQQKAAMVKDSFIEMLVKGTDKTAESISFDKYKLFAIWPEAPSGNGNASTAKIVADRRFEKAKGHLLLGEFENFTVAQKGFDSLVKFGGFA